MTRSGLFAVLVFGLVMAFSGSAFAQGNNGGGRQRGAGGAGGAGGGNFDPAQMRERMMTRLKEQLGANDDEWKVLQPKVEKVMDAQRDTRGGGFGGFGGRGGGGGGGGGGADAANQSAVAKASADLRTAVENKDAPADDLKAKLAALRDARTKARETLAASQKELNELLTQRQEAVLVVNGMLE